MGESRNHIDLVAVAYHCALSIVPRDLEALVQADTADSPKPTRVIGNFVPDVFFWNGKLLVIGEAKTFEDFDRPHSLSQYDAYMQECHNFPGTSFLIISVPWQLVFTAKNYFRRMKTKGGYHFRIIVVNEINVRYEI